MSSVSLLVLVCTAIVAADDVLVKTSSGVVKGFTTPYTREFRGVPFATPPIGSLRWASPVPAAPWGGVWDATYYRPACMQVPDAQPNITVVSEDCLYLNVMTPVNASADSGLAVMLWIYGGSFLSGSGEIYDGTDLIKEGNVVFVSFNYRLGPLGFLSLASLADGGESTGNYGFQDQRLAFQWVQQNIAAFGGDPTKVTIFGESAGAISVCSHLAAPRSAGLFRAALMESGFCTLFTLNASETIGNNLSSTVGCAGLTPSGEVSCMRDVAPEILIDTNPLSYWSPTIDGVEFVGQPLSYLQNGTFNRVPLLLGTNRNEEGLFLCPQYENITAPQYVDIVSSAFGGRLAPTLLGWYNVTDYATPVQALIDLYTDFEFVCPTRRVATAVSDVLLPVYLYSFAHRASFDPDTCVGVGHSFELPFIYSDLLALVNGTFTPAEQRLAREMRQYWTTFANNLTPTGVVPWSYFSDTTDRDVNILLNLTISMESGYREKHCAMWDDLLR